MQDTKSSHLQCKQSSTTCPPCTLSTSPRHADIANLAAGKDEMLTHSPTATWDCAQSKPGISAAQIHPVCSYNTWSILMSFCIILQNCKALQDHIKSQGKWGKKEGMGGRKIKKLLAVVCELHEPITETPDAKCSIELNSSTHYSLCICNTSKSCVE